MGVAFGEFEPAPDYSLIKKQCQDNHSDQSALGMSVQTEVGVDIPCIVVSILDYSGEIECPYIEVNLIGVPYPLYQEIFPEHVAAYDERFKST